MHGVESTRGNARIGVVAGTTAVLVATATGLLFALGGGEPATVTAEPIPTPTVTATPAAALCSTAASSFVPTSVSIPGVVKKISVAAMRRDAQGVPGTPPLTDAGKVSMAFDLGSGIRPGDPNGNALLNAHTWPDGSGLGNKLLAGLDLGDRLTVQGPKGKICYQVTDRVEVAADDPGKRYYAKKGQPQIAIVVCSGKRIGPGQWTKRTLWFASPVA